MFDDIRPFNNNEVAQVTESLINEEELQSSIAKFVFPKCYQIFPSLTRKAIKLYLKYQQKHLVSIDKIQLEVSKYLSRLVKKSTDGFTYSGIENLPKNKPCLFISNHRDIVLDVALVNLALYHSDLTTVEAAVGDNLLSKQWVADLMRINKSFIVKRNAENKRAMLKASKELSAYIHHALTEKQQNIWIAQREGRAKDGLDITNPALISMLLLNKEKSQPIESYLETLNIIPVSISYEFDPCDRDKSIELATIDETGVYEKGEHEDLQSITQGMIGDKGKVHLTFCKPITGEYENSKSIAEAIDSEVINNYKLYDSNLSAYSQICQSDKKQDLNQRLEGRMEGLTKAQKNWLLNMYANPVKAQKSYNANI